jgi:hypothetical protein
MVPSEFTAYFAAATAAAGVLIGLLFVAASLRSEAVFGEKAVAAAQAVSGSAFTALVNSFFVALMALIPYGSLGIEVTVMALLSIYGTVRLHLGLSRHDTARVQLVLALLAYLTQLVVGTTLIFRPHSVSLVNDVTYLLIASFAVALRRAWSLLQGKQVREAATTAAPAAGLPESGGEAAQAT